MANYRYSCNRCKQYDDLNGFFCRICGGSVQFDDKSRAKINVARVTDEKYCDHCGKSWHGGTSCSSKKDIKY